MTEKVTTTVNEGKVRGIRNKSRYSGVKFYSFYGIPYGQAPTKNLRFKDPIKVKPWKNVMDASTEKGGCIQFSYHHCQIIGTEDCLYTNIHTPSLPSEENILRPVIINVHLGGYMFGSPDTDQCGSPNFVMHHDIVYVSIGYRLHILGFLNLGIEDCSGNQALKDIILGLRWIQDNIRSFNGDPDNVTLLGSSSGGSIINFLMICPRAKGLFHKAVIMGPHVLNPSVPFSQDHLSVVLKIVRRLGYKGDDSDKHKLLFFLKRTDPKMLLLQNRIAEKERNENIANLYPASIFLPTVDYGEEAVLPQPFDELIKHTIRIPLIFGICEKETFMGFSKSVVTEATNTLLRKSFCQNCYSWGYTLRKDQLDFINKEMDSFYMNGKSIDKASLSLKIDIQTDASHSNLYDSLIDVIAADLPSVFVYQFTYEGPIRTLKDAMKITLSESVEGTFHSSDYSHWIYLNRTPRDQPEKMVDIFTKLITTFAKTGDPTYDGCKIRWRSTTPQNPCYLRIDNELEMVDSKLNGKRMEFWENLRKQINQLP